MNISTPPCYSSIELTSEATSLLWSTKIHRALLLLAFILSTFVFVTLAAAKPINWPSEQVSITVQDQPLRKFLHDFFSAMGQPVLISNSIRGNISGQFSNSPQKIFSDVVKAYGLVSYYDGTAVHIATNSELRSETVKLPPHQINKFVARIVDRELADDHQTIEVESSTGTVQIKGIPQFVNDVKKVVSGLTPPPKPATKQVTTVAQKFNPPPPQALVFKTFQLKFASAADTTFFQNDRQVTIPGIASLLRNMVGDGHSPASIGTTYGQPADSTVPKLGGKGLHRYSVNSISSDSQANGASEIQSTTMLSAATNRTSRVRIQAEPNINAVIVRDYPDAMPLYAGLIEQLDVEPNLIEIQVTIIDVDKNKLRDLGVNWQYNSDDTSARLGGGEVLQQAGGLILNTVLGNAGRFFANINALADQGSANVVSRPQIVTVSNLEAVLANDQTFFVRVAGDRNVDLFDVSVGTSLRVVPNVVGDRDDPKIRLLVTIEDGSIDAQATVDEIPVIERSSLTTQAIIFNGESLLIGGLARESTSVTTRKVPLLGDVPAVGRLFRRDTNVEINSERLFLISPKIITSGRSRPQRDSTSPKTPASMASATTRESTAQQTVFRSTANEESSTNTRSFVDGF